MLYLLFLVAVALIVWLYFLSRSQTMALQSLSLHPFNVLGVLIFVISIDFLVTYSDLRNGLPVSYATWSVSGTQEVIHGYIFFLLTMLVSVFAIWAATSSRFSSAAQAPPVATVQDLGTSRWTFLICCLIGLLIAVGVAVDSLRHGNLLYIATTRQNFFVQNPLLNIAIGTLFPAFVIFGARRGLTAPVILGAAVVISIQFILGTRGQILATLIALTFWTAQRYRFIKLPIIYATLPILGYLLVFYRYIARDRVFFNSFGKFLEVSGGVSGVIFRSVDVPNAEIHAIALSNGHILRRAPWDWLLGALLAPVPRAWAPFKPLGPSSQFTLESVPLRYLLYRSELVVTGPIGIYFDVGYVGAILITAFLFFLWARMLLRSSTKQWAAMFGPIGIMVCYQFLRNDFYNTALMIWPTALAFCIFGVISKFRQIKNSAPTACSVGFDGAPR